MSSIENSNQNPPPVCPAVPAPEAWIGLDWGNTQHAFALQDRSGHTERGPLVHTSENLHQWPRQIGQRYGRRPVALAIEASRGAVHPCALELRLADHVSDQPHHQRPLPRGLHSLWSQG